MRPAPLRSLLAALASTCALVAACGGNGDGDSMLDASAGDAASAIDAAAAIDARPPTACVVTVAASGAACNDDCEAHLFLPAGTAYCTLFCATDGDCTPYGADLTCAAEVGTCMPRCVDDGGCQAAGFPRCHPLGSFCDTIPACSGDQQCIDLGYERCVMPGAYCG